MGAEEQIKALALAQGFDLAGIASLSSLPEHLGHYAEWLDTGHAGEMAYLERQKEKRLNPELVLPGAKSILCLGLIYNTLAQPYSTEVPQPALGLPLRLGRRLPRDHVGQTQKPGG